MTKTIRLILALLTMVAGVAFVVAAVTAPAGASPYGHPFKCTTVQRTKPSGVTIVTLRCSGRLPDGTFAKFQCRQKPVPQPCKGPALLPTFTAPPPSTTSTASAAAAPTAKVLVVLHSTPRVIGSFAPNSNGIVNATFSIPRGFTGHHTIEARVVTSNSPEFVAPVLSNKIAANTTRVMIPITVGVDSVVTRTSTSAAGAPSDSDNWATIAVVGVGALGVVMLAGGGLLMYAGRRRRVPA